MKRILILILLSGLVLPTLYSQPTVGEAVDNFTLTDIDGEVHTLYDYLDDGQFVCIDFFGTTCNTCIDLVPDFNFTYTEYGCNSADVIFLSIDNLHSNIEVDDFRKEFGTIYPLVSGIEGGGAEVFESWEIFYTPQLVLVNPDHTIETIISPISAATIRDAFDEAEIERASCTPSSVESLQASRFSIIPNPASTQFSLAFIKNKTAIEYIRIYTIAGQLKLEKRYNLEAPIEVSSLNAGLYLVEVKTSEGRETLKLIVK